MKNRSPRVRVWEIAERFQTRSAGATPRARPARDDGDTYSAGFARCGVSSFGRASERTRATCTASGRPGRNTVRNCVCHARPRTHRVAFGCRSGIGKDRPSMTVPKDTRDLPPGTRFRSRLVSALTSKAKGRRRRWFHSRDAPATPRNRPRKPPWCVLTFVPSTPSPAHRSEPTPVADALPPRVPPRAG